MPPESITQPLIPRRRPERSAPAGETASYGTCGGRPCNFGPGMTPDQVRSTTILLLLNPKNGYAHATQLPNGEWVNDLFLRQIPY
jgi:hypothetical protein